VFSLLILRHFLFLPKIYFLLKVMHPFPWNHLCLRLVCGLDSREKQIIQPTNLSGFVYEQHKACCTRVICYILWRVSCCL